MCNSQCGVVIVVSDITHTVGDVWYGESTVETDGIDMYAWHIVL